MLCIITFNILLSLAQIPIVLECEINKGDADFGGCEGNIHHLDIKIKSFPFWLIYMLGSSCLTIIYLLEVGIFVYVFLDVRTLFKYLNPETYNQLKCSFGVYIFLVFTFLVFRVGYYISL